jgi:cyclophilin family peptidyl-prolyl cis-trans isomerase
MPCLRAFFPLLALSASACVTPADSADSADGDTAADSGGESNTVTITTSKGEITVELDPTNAPTTTANFLTYVDEGFFDGDDGEGATTFHRVIPGFMIQGGGYTAAGATKTTHDAIVLESDNGLSNLRGTIAMARTSVPDSATSQFFINVADNTTLDYQNANNPGYAVFGTVTAGMDVADAIVAVDRDASDKPDEAIEITDCERQ